MYSSGQKATYLQRSCDEVKARRPHNAIPIVMDRGKEEEVDALFEHIKKEEGGQLDMCAKNALARPPDPPWLGYFLPLPRTTG